MSNNGPRRSGSNWRDLETDPRGGAEDDPLSELARLIEEDPFADFDRDRHAAAPRNADHDPEWSWEDQASDAAETPAQTDDYAQPDHLEWDPEQGAYVESDIYAEPHAAWGQPDNAAPQAYDELYAEAVDPYAPATDPYAPASYADEEYAAGQRDRGVLYAGDRAIGDAGEGAPHFDDSGHLSPHEPAGKRGGRKTLVFGTIALLLAVGGAGAYYYSDLTPSADSGEPVLIAAETEPYKTMPEEPGGETVPNQDKLVYDRASGLPASGKTEERIVSREEPVENVPMRDRAVREAGEGQVPAEQTADDVKRVRTVVVKPDGTIVEEPAEVEQQVREVAMLDGDAGPVTLYDSQSSDAQPAPADAADAPAADASPAAGVPTPPALPTSGRPAAGAQNAFVPPSANQAETSGQPLQLVPQATTAPQAPTAPQGQSTAATRAAGEASLPVQSGAQQQAAVQPQAQPAASTSGFPSGSYVVQVSSTKSEADANSTASQVRQRYANVISGYQTDVQRADLGDRGVFYRVSVGPLSDTSSAASLCGRLKSAGLDCFVRRN